jgi:hypothetical protein
MTRRCKLIEIKTLKILSRSEHLRMHMSRTDLWCLMALDDMCLLDAVVMSSS